ncbi:MAG: exo-alpha-sialidase [Bacteroidaceae bacterium]|nr:exo-alpha-sialidase [Bacteroidaceae bacterium]
MKKKVFLAFLTFVAASIGTYAKETATYTTKVEQGKVTTGIGNKNVPILRSTLTVSGLTGTVNMQGITGKVVATNLKDVKAIRAYFATNAQELFVDTEGKMTWRQSNAIPYAKGKIAKDGTYTITGNRSLAAGTYYLWIALDVAKTAVEGNTVDATITSYTIDGKMQEESNGDPANAATIFLTESSVLMPMDKGSQYYRIPAICTSADGKRLVTLTDDRKDHNADLPYHCYVVAQHSEDNGRSWSNPVIVAGTAETGGDYGHGDASLITNCINGDIIGIMTSSPNGTGFFSSTPDKPQAWKTIVSHDGGITWEPPVDHTKELYAAGSPHPNWLGGFTGSGAGLQKRDGTLVSPFVNRESPDGTNNNITQNYYNFMSKDGGKTWFVNGKSGTTAADEPKVLERNNGDLAISVRAGGYNFYNVTSDGGNTWKNAPQTRFTTGINGNACDGEYMYWCSTLDGNPWNIVFQTLPNSNSRQNLSIALSTDEGETFGTAKTICPRGSAYSSATILPDGTLGVYYEEEGLFGCYTMRFVRFSLNWASNGKFAFTKKQPFKGPRLNPPL